MKLEKKWRFKATEWRRKLSRDRNPSGENENKKIQKVMTERMSQGQDRRRRRDAVTVHHPYYRWIRILTEPPVSVLPRVSFQTINHCSPPAALIGGLRSNTTELMSLSWGWDVDKTWSWRAASEDSNRGRCWLCVLRQRSVTPRWVVSIRMLNRSCSAPRGPVMNEWMWK